MKLLILILLFPFIAQGQIVRTHPYYKPFSASCSYLLDQYSGANLGLSLRKLKNSYSGNSIRVRRSNDNSEQDIGFIGQCGELDTTSLLSFVGSNSAYVVKVYNQTGGTDAIQSTSTSQPRIVNAGVIDRLGGKPAMYFDGGDLLVIGSLALNTYNATFVVMQSNSNGIIVEHGPTANSVDGFFFYTTKFSSWKFRRSGSENAADGETNWSGTSRIIAELQYNSSGGVYYKNGTAQNNNTTFGSVLSNTSTTKDLHIFSRTGLVVPITGYLQELVLYDSDQSSNRTSILSNINTYYSVY